jgi:multiple sugar transport system substrate-binding protein
LATSASAPPVPASAEVAPSPVGSVTLGAAAPIEDVIAAFTAETGIRVRTNTLDFNTLGETLDDYLTGAPQDVLMFLTGYLLRDVASRGLLEPIDDLWSSVGAAFPPTLKEASTGDDGHLYAIPHTHGPWAVFYRRSVFDGHGYEIPTTWADYLALVDRMRRDDLVPMGFADFEQFPALGVFDILDLRLNGYEFHLDLLAGREPWTDRRVRDVFDLFRRFLETAQSDPLTRQWADAAADLAERRAGMLYFGSFVTTVIPAEVVPDLGMFAFPSLGTAFDAERSVEDPSDAYLVPARSRTMEADLDSTKAFLEYMSRPDVQATVALIAGGPSALPGVRLGAAAASPLQAEAAGIIEAAQHATQFLDRDTTGRFGKLFGQLMKDFLADPGQRIEPFLDRAQATWTESS